MKRVLIYPSDSEIAREIHDALKNNKKYQIVGGSSFPLEGKGSFLFDENYYVPFITEPKDFIKDHLIKLMEQFNIDYIFPAHDDVCLVLSEILPEVTIGLSYENNLIFRNKEITYKFIDSLKIESLKHPIVYEYPCFPMFVKPKCGNGSRGAQLIENQTSWNNYLLSYNMKDTLMMEYLSGKEYTIDCISQNGKLLFCGARERVTTKTGISEISKTVYGTFFEYIADELSKTIKNGIWFFQTKEDSEGNLKLLEIGPRVSGGMQLYRMAGINFPEIAIEIFERNKINISTPIFYELEFCKFFEPRYKTNKISYDNIYIDFDDTLYLHCKNQFNTELIQFLAQCKNENKKIYLLTRSKNNYTSLLKKFGIYNWFEQIYYVEDGISKVKYIKPYSILIDDSFSERNSININNIYTFNIDNFKVLFK